MKKSALLFILTNALVSVTAHDTDSSLPTLRRDLLSRSYSIDGRRSTSDISNLVPSSHLHKRGRIFKTSKQLDEEAAARANQPSPPRSPSRQDTALPPPPPSSILDTTSGAVAAAPARSGQDVVRDIPRPPPPGSLPVSLQDIRPAFGPHRPYVSLSDVLDRDFPELAPGRGSRDSRNLGSPSGPLASRLPSSPSGQNSFRYVPSMGSRPSFIHQPLPPSSSPQQHPSGQAGRWRGRGEGSPRSASAAARDAGPGAPVSASAPQGQGSRANPRARSRSPFLRGSSSGAAQDPPQRSDSASPPPLVPLSATRMPRSPSTSPDTSGGGHVGTSRRDGSGGRGSRGRG